LDKDSLFDQVFGLEIAIFQQTSDFDLVTEGRPYVVYRASAGQETTFGLLDTRHTYGPRHGNSQGANKHSTKFLL
jgi:hypothetical protein